MLSWEPVGSGMPTGYKYIYNNGGSNTTTTDTNTVVYEGFEEAKKTVDRIELTKSPTDVTYKNGENYQNPVKVYLKDSISEKLDGKEIEIKHRGQIVKYKIVYQDKPIEIFLK